MKKIVSIHYTYIFKFVFPLAMTLVLLVELIYIFNEIYIYNHTPNFSHRYVIYIICGAFFLYSYVVGIRLKKISIDKKVLYISNFNKEIEVSFNDIKKIYLKFMPYFVWIRLNVKTIFGKNILFMPKSYSIGIELNSIVNKNALYGDVVHSEKVKKEFYIIKKRLFLLLFVFICCVLLFFAINYF